MKPTTQSPENCLTLLRQGGFRVTKIRQAVIETLHQKRCPLSAIELIAALKKLNPNKVTIYRELAFLTKQNIVKQTALGDGLLRYELTSLPHHHHIICTHCHRVEPIELPKNFCEQVQQRASKTKFTQIKHIINLFGRCGRCQVN